MHEIMKNICLITYDTQHLKTAQVFFGLNNRSEFKLSFLSVPFKKREPRKTKFAHRPFQFTGAGARELATAFELPFFDYEQREKVLDEHDYLIVCGANILEPKFANSGKIINGHAGLIPNVRGLDSFKWAIQDKKMIGNTLHIIDEHADAGQVLHQLKTPLFSNDTLEDFAARHYQNEIWLLTHFDKFLTGGTFLDLAEDDSRMRMPLSKEDEMIASFSAYREQYAIA